MIKIYYKICVDFIVKSKDTNEKNWKFATIMYLSAFLGITLMSVIIILEKTIPSLNYLLFGHKIYELLYNQKLAAVLFFFFPALIINYFLLFYKNRYEVLLQKDKPNNGKYIIRFMIFSILLVLICIFV
ncbi:hypothetical protein [Flavobacterium sp.]|uniref:hypothetical protein n=1 Tax=Flavobacterium sp. TaxID=239 RepID=UPI003267487E